MAKQADIRIEDFISREEQREGQDITPHSPSLQYSRTYLPLNGRELTEIVLANLKEKLIRANVFMPHITYPKVEWEILLRVKTFGVVPSDEMYSLRGELGEKNDSLEQTGGTTVTASSDGKTLIPDQARREADLPVPVIVEKGGQKVVEDRKLPSSSSPSSSPSSSGKIPGKS